MTLKRYAARRDANEREIVATLEPVKIWSNVMTAHHRWMARFLQRRGWVVFYLDERARFCLAAQGRADVDCWLALYQSQISRDR